MLTKRFFFLWFLMLPFWNQQAAHAAVGGNVSGTVTDRKGAVIPGARGVGDQPRHGSPTGGRNQ
jgi:hypothetical protein